MCWKSLNRDDHSFALIAVDNFENTRQTGDLWDGHTQIGCFLTNSKGNRSPINARGLNQEKHY
jgi:hypothetical protein